MIIEKSNTIYVENSSLENQIVEEGNNTYLKAYTSKTQLNEISLNANNSFTQNGTYLVSMDVKIIVGETKLDNLGFRLYGAKRPTIKDYGFNLLTINSTEWTTIYTVIEIDNLEQSSWTNMFIWVFTHNDKLQSQENYVLIDNVKIQLQTVDIK